MNRRATTLAVLIVGVLIILGNTLFIVDQTHQALVLRLAEPVRVINTLSSPAPGLHVKIPFMETVHKLDRRNQTLEVDSEEITAADQERLVVDAFLRYRISNPLLYYQAFRTEGAAQNRIERLVSSSLRQVLGRATTTEIISVQRGALMNQARVDVTRRAKLAKLGIDVVDLRIRRADMPAQNLPSAYESMQAALQQQAASNRAAGEQEKRTIIAEADKEVTITLATAQEEAQTTRGEGDALRTRIFAQSFGKDAGFAAFYRSMQAYETALGKGDTTMVLSPDSAFFKYFERGPSAR